MVQRMEKITVVANGLEGEKIFKKQIALTHFSV